MNSKKHIAKKQFGQNFLMNKNVVHRMIKVAEIKAHDTVLEIGPGKGTLTDNLILSGAKVLAVEKDRDLLPLLKNKFKESIKSKRLLLIEGDIRDVSLSRYKLQASGYKLVANIPYYITGELIRIFLENKKYPSRMVLMVQKEVAQRIVARNSKESILSISVKAYGKPTIVSYVGRGNFTPAPNVDSAIIKIDDISKNFFKGFSEKAFFKILKAGFAHKRKFLFSNLSNIVNPNKLKPIFEKIGLSHNIRPENLTLSDWQNLFFMISEVKISL